MIWKMLEYFKRSEAWGDPDRMDIYLLILMEKIRGSFPAGCWVKVHKGFATQGHSPQSQHYVGKAVDFHVVGCTLRAADSHIMRYLHNTGMIDVVGIGIYPQWKDPGFHLDTRGERASWAKLEGKYVAYPLGLEHAEKHKL